MNLMCHHITRQQLLFPHRYTIGSDKIGVLIFQMPIDRINNIMTNDHNWQNVGLGISGETYLAGADYLLRNQSRFLIEDSENYFRLIDNIGVPVLTIARIRNLNSTIGLQEVKTQGDHCSIGRRDWYGDIPGLPRCFCFVSI